MPGHGAGSGNTAQESSWQAETLSPFYLGCAWESVARAHAAAGMFDACAETLARAQVLAETVGDAADRKALEGALEEIKGFC